MLVDFGGTALLVSHDRAFLNNVVTSTLAIDSEGTVKEYDGGYDDFLRQRPGKPTAEPAPKKSDPTTAAAAQTQEKARKLNNKERRELDSLPGKIDELETAVQTMHTAMADPSYYKRNGAELASDTARMKAMEEELAAAYARWEELA